MSELKQCPKCSPNGAPLRRIGEMDEYRVECVECYTVKTPWFKTPGEAEAYWNAFAEGMKLQAARIAELEAERDRLREALKEIVMLSTVDQVCNNCRHCQKLRNMDWCAWYCNAVDDSSTQGCRKFEMADFHNSDVHTIARKALKGAENDQV